MSKVITDKQAQDMYNLLSLMIDTDAIDEFVPVRTRQLLDEIDSQDDDTQDVKPKFVARGSNKTGWFIIHFNTGIPYSTFPYESYDNAQDEADKLNAQVQS